MLRFTLLTLTLVLVIAAFLVMGSQWAWYSTPSYSFEILFFFTLTNVGLFWFISTKVQKQPDAFVGIYLGATVIRILFFGGFILVVIRLDTDGATKNALFFLICYCLYTALEIGMLYHQIKSAGKGQKDG